MQKPSSLDSVIAMKFAESCNKSPYVPTAGDCGISNAENLTHPLLLSDVVNVMRFPDIEYPVTHHAHTAEEPRGCITRQNRTARDIMPPVYPFNTAEGGFPYR